MEIMNKDTGIGKELRNWNMALARAMPRKCARANIFAINHFLLIE